jgi:small nuclear ribonucleoprotein (snRNP)-like protein
MNGLEQMLNDRFLGLSITNIGERVTIETCDSITITGLFHSIDPGCKYIILANPIRPS